MSLFRGSKNATVSTGDIVATQADIANAVTLVEEAQAASEAAQAAAEAALDNFDDRFLGAFSSAPTTDNDGDPIVAGAVYYDTTQQEVYFYNGATWDAPAAQAETSATNALASENAAETSANEAATSASNASDSETAAANSASAAATSESNAATSETNAANSASDAATSETNAAQSENNAANSASAAATSESNAATSATNASNSASAAATSETNAASSASAAASSETNAANSASAAATSESNAATSAQNAADSFDSFDDRYLGSKTSEPTTDNDGDPLLEGALYYDSTSGALRFYDGTSWNTIATRSNAEIRALFSGSGDIVYNSSTGEFSVTTYKSSDFDTDFSGKTTTDLTEGSNLYYTDTRARSAVSASGDLSYDSATGVFSFTETPNYTDADVDAHLTGGTGVAYNSGNISIGQDVSTTADVSFNSINVDSGTLFVDSANNRVGIGTSSPSKSLHVNGAGLFNFDLNLQDPNPGTVVSPDLVFRNGDGNENGRVWADNADLNLRSINGPLTFRPNNSEAMRIDSSGNVGIGTSSPDSTLDVNGDIKSTGTSAVLKLQSTGATVNASRTNVLMFSNDFSLQSRDSSGNFISNDYVIRKGDNGAILHQWRIDDSEAMRIASSGNVGIGTTTPDAKIDINSGGISGTKLLRFETDRPWYFAQENTGPSTNLLLVAEGNGKTFKIRNFSGQDIARFFGSDSGNSVDINGSLSKNSGSFRIDHPLPEKSETHYLVHSFVESPRADNVYRGTATLSNGTAQVNLDAYIGMTEGTFSALNGNIDVFLQNKTGWEPLKGEVIDNILHVYCRDEAATDTISWMVVGERQDQHMLDTKWTDEFGRPVLEPEKEIEQEIPDDE